MLIGDDMDDSLQSDLPCTKRQCQRPDIDWKCLGWLRYFLPGRHYRVTYLVWIGGVGGQILTGDDADDSVVISRLLQGEQVGCIVVSYHAQCQSVIWCLQSKEFILIIIISINLVFHTHVLHTGKILPSFIFPLSSVNSKLGKKKGYNIKLEKTRWINSKVNINFKYIIFF